MLETFRYGIFRLADRLNKEEQRVSTYTPRLWIIRARWLESKIYPKSKGSNLSTFDKYLSIIIIISIFMLVLELLSEPETALVLSYSSFFFLAIFLSEFAIRLYLRGWGYFRFWGWFDVIVILGDLIVCLSLIFGSQLLEFIAVGNLEPEDVLPFVRIIRLFRLGRAVKLFFQFSKGQGYFKRQWKRFKPLLFSLIGSILLAAAAALACLVLAALFFGANIYTSVTNFVTLVAAGLFEESPGSIDPDPTRMIETMENIAALVVVLAITTIVTQIFVALLSSTRGPTDRELIASLTGHTIVYVNSDKLSGVVEEVDYLFSDVLGGDVLILSHPGTSFAEEALLEYPGRASTGSMFDPATWKSTGAIHSRTIICLSELGMTHDELSAMLKAIGSEEFGGKIDIIELSSEQSYSRVTLDDDWNSSYTVVPYFKIEDSIEQSVWRTGSNINLAYKSVERFLGISESRFEELASTLSGRDSERMRTEVSDLLESRSVNARVAESGGALQIWFDDDALESSEISALACLLAELEAGTLSASGPIFFFVRSFELLGWQELFDDLKQNPVQILALELILVQSIFHELSAPGSVHAWLGVECGAITVSPKDLGLIPLKKRRFLNRHEVHREFGVDQEELLILGVSPLDATRPKLIFADETADRFAVDPSDELIVSIGSTRFPLSDSDNH